jgi:iron complex outermembrane receptor protein
LNYRNEAESAAAFAQGTYHLTDKLSMIGGLRYTRDKKNLDQVSPFTRTLDESFSEVNWAATLNYKINADMLAYARVATGYKSGGFNARSANSGFEPEDLTSYEAGLKSEFFDRRLRLNTTAFYAKHKNLQIQQFQAGTGGAVSITVNAGEAEYKGIEIEGEALLAEGLTVSGAFGYVDREFNEFLILNPATNSFVDVAQSARFTYASDVTWNAAAQYEFPPLDFGKLTARAEYSYRGKVYFFPTLIGTPLNEEIAGASRGLLDARLTLSDLSVGGVNATLSVWGKNLTDKEYRIHGIDFGGLGYAGNIYGEPRSVGVDVNFGF